jgi:hypothetical protein
MQLIFKVMSHYQMDWLGFNVADSGIESFSQLNISNFPYPNLIAVL